MLELIGGLFVALIFWEIAFKSLLEYFDRDANKQSKKVLEESRERRRRESLLADNTSGSKD